MESPEILENWKAAGLLTGLGCGAELRKLSGAIVEGEKGVVKTLKPLGMAALQSAIGATVGTIVGKNVGRSSGDQKGEKNIASAASAYQAGFSEGMRRALVKPSTT